LGHLAFFLVSPAVPLPLLQYERIVEHAGTQIELIFAPVLAGRDGKTRIQIEDLCLQSTFPIGGACPQLNPERKPCRELSLNSF